MDLQRRVTGILTSPHAEWRAIADERTDIGSLYRDYIAVVAAVPAASLVLGLAVFGVPILGRWEMTAAIS
ncbi:MAG: hypothetical protein AB7P22_14080, partial [Vicinamibacterales bacterium]